MKSYVQPPVLRSGWIMKIVLLNLLLLISLCSYARAATDKKITGKVVDSKDSSPLPGVNVLIKGTGIGTSTDASGNYEINVPNESSVLVFSFVGFTSQEITVGNQSLIDVNLATDAKALTEVVVIGYGTVRKSDLTGAVATIKGEQLVDKPVPNVSQALQGKIAGVEVSVNSNAPGAAAKVRVRGIGSINSNIDPLYVVDGVIGVDGNSINPNDIASLEVLKDASSTAIYGARGANGVIMITTKRGRAGTMKVSYDGNVNVSDLYRHVKTLNSDEFVKVYNEAYANGTKFDPAGGTWAPPAALNHANFPLLFDANDKPLYNTNWEKEVYKPAISTNHSLNFQGGNDKTLFSLSLGYLNQNGLMATSAFKRYNLRFTVDTDVNKWLKVGGSLSLINSRQRMVSDGNGGLNVPRMVSEEVPILPVKYPDGTWAGNNDIAGLEGGPNPVNIAHNRYTINNTLQSLGNTYLLFHIAKDLDFKTDLGFNLQSQKNNFFSSQNLAHMSADQGGVANIRGYLNTYWQSENYLTWNKTINQRHRITALLGASWQQYNQETDFVETQNFIDDIFQWHTLGSGSVRSSSTSADYKWAMNSYFARATYNLDEKYLFTATGRYDGSSKFGANNKYAFFPSVGAAWRVSEEGFLKGNKTITNLKVRASYGLSGNQEIGQYQSIAQIQPGTTNATSTVLNGALQSTLLPSYLGNPNLKWERSLQFDAGVELGIRENIDLTVDYYNRVTKDLLLQAPIPWSAGEVNANVYQNVGSVRNSGFEVSLNTTNIETRNFSWTTNFIFATNVNKILKLNKGNADIFPGPNFLGQTNILRVGEPIGSLYGMTRIGTYSTDEAALAAEHNLKPGDRKYIYNADGSNYYSIIGRTTPKWTGSFNSTMKYKGWDFSFNIRFVEGLNTAATFKHSVEDRQTIANSLATVLNAWTPTNQNTMISQVRNYKFAQDSHFDTWWVENGSFIRGQNFMLGYSFNDPVLEKLRIDRLRLYASVQNLFVITKYTGYDPEVDTFNSGYGANTAFSQNLDFFSNPRPRVWNLGLTLTF
ncbi:TonB-linked SusC/RagA family outer membrane protein [Dyadobacter sp. BE34]|uniref:TonB-linked SusC/RagA family outer membrane protein n=1 Tax=Dyadobacter fermentans TaxID=94254 RepID=A0ABU1QV46_9BACT|nr:MULTISPECIES: TonB-dependent receptor [Dyadobacter]MDR6805023.1 TonB-linked SusC/RagA family outer membrane protein [Dyadobacter fermentans]MDR7043218.1 TonB-linked SusC/RagA family outer membrane protein [Dyadobacter sp. BE242]MDR7197530.1 TonB-linked SusC/RagA family outer membrane protein [Dyadobacter sp. BE34]MDR7215037.1 TonB-linked SusC/RagA family outer membrane protein [Dyadobacter sp. BE31]MDR7262572.1 TonB-linked SusC/RagA family outer membrane protein [Dyadobacter sp. BE32]